MGHGPISCDESEREVLDSLDKRLIDLGSPNRSDDKLVLSPQEAQLCRRIVKEIGGSNDIYADQYDEQDLESIRFLREQLQV